ncbi:MAG: PD40 domain-containing protein, partial [Chloroflexi bacterium]|nr:PD40 domain-containing protein [Chloroflexota bacterium]
MNESRAKCALVVLWTLLLLSGLWTAKAVAWAPSSPNNAERPSHAAHSVASAPRPAQIAPNTTIRISISSNGVQANGNCYYPSVSDDGRYVAFASDADNLVPGDTFGARDIFVHDL